MKCAICGKEITDYGNNPWPVRLDEEARCCNECNFKYVLAARMAIMNASPERVETVAVKLNTKTPDELDLLFDLE